MIDTTASRIGDFMRRVRKMPFVDGHLDVESPLLNVGLHGRPHISDVALTTGGAEQQDYPAICCFAQHQAATQ